MSYHIYETFDKGNWSSWHIIIYPFTWALRDDEVKPYQNLTKRLQSFENWPESNKGPSKLQLAISGFYYTGKTIDFKICCSCFSSLISITGESDICKCFSCGLKLHSWEESDKNPAYEHAKWDYRCSFLWLVSGQDFCETVGLSHNEKGERRVRNESKKEEENKKLDRLKAEGGPQYNTDTELESNLACAICYTQPREVLYQPCGHLG